MEHVATHKEDASTHAPEPVMFAICRAALYEAAALGFRPPTAETVACLTRPPAVDSLADTARFLERGGQAAGLAEKVGALARPGIELAELESSFRTLFGHTARGEVPPYETEYGNEAVFQQPQELSDLAGFLTAFGLKVRPEAHERVDHVSCECEFLSFLSYKQAWALTHGDEEMLEMTERATVLFLRDHVGRFVPAFARQLKQADRAGWYAALGTMLVDLVRAECRRLEIPIGAERLGLRPDPAVCTAPMGCAGGDEGCPSASGEADDGER